jgi:outer membrane protein assembly factor BamB
MIFTNCVKNLNGSNGDFVAINRHTGEIIYRTPLKHYAWSSPVAFLNENDEMFIFTADTCGYVYIIDGISGEIILSKLVGQNFESSPVVIGNSIVIGSRGNSIFKMSLK